MRRALSAKLARAPHRALTALWAGLAFMLLLLDAAPARAYPWMIRHDYVTCGSCHVDPSGAGLLTEYGRAQSEVLLRTRYGEVPEDEDPTKLGGFAFGALKLPEGMLLQADVRTMNLLVKPPAPAEWVRRFILMQADAHAGVVAGRLRASGSLGVVDEGGLGAAVTRGDASQARMVARQYWVGVTLGEDESWLLRAGRMNLPYGLRILEHTAWVRSMTRTDINTGQQHGAALSYVDEKWRGEVMGIAGNFQLRPYQLHEYGYSAYLERALGEHAAAGVSSLTTYTPTEIESQAATVRQSHGLFGRYAPVKSLVLLAEADLMLRSPSGLGTKLGLVSLLQADFEPIQGVHVLATGELADRALGDLAPSFGAWLGASWFFLPHMDMRFDVIRRSEALTVGGPRIDSTSILGQFHAFL